MKINSKMHSLGKMICFLFICSIFLFQTKAFAQISASGAVTNALTAYTNPSVTNDPIFVFCDASGVGSGELTAISSDKTAGWSFEWMKWNTTTNSFIIPVGTTSTISNVNNGRYQVRLSKSGEADQIFIAWVLNRRVSTIKPLIEVTAFDCGGVHLRGSYSGVLEYNDIGHVGNKKLYAGLQYKFQRVNSKLQQFAGDWSKYQSNYIYQTDEIPFEGEEEYALMIKDECGNEYVSATITSETKRVLAKFKFYKINDSGTEEEINESTNLKDEKEEAPLEAILKVDFSANISNYTWKIYKDTDDNSTGLTDENLVFTQSGVSFSKLDYTFENTGYYLVRLKVEGKGCTHTYEKYILLYESLVDVPNFFMPGSGGEHNTWRFATKSLKNFSCVIFNRWGRVVYETKNPNDAWNGKYHGSYVSPGTYFYVIKAVGLEEDYPKYVKKGSITVLRR